MVRVHRVRACNSKLEGIYFWTGAVLLGLVASAGILLLQFGYVRLIEVIYNKVH